jgi:hypothetical protein
MNLLALQDSRQLTSCTTTGNILNTDGSVTKLFDALVAFPHDEDVAVNFLFKDHRNAIIRHVDDHGKISLTFTETLPGGHGFSNSESGFKIELVESSDALCALLTKYAYARLSPGTDFSLMDGDTPAALRFIAEFVKERVTDRGSFNSAWRALFLQHDVTIDELPPAGIGSPPRTCADFKTGDRVKVRHDKDNTQPRTTTLKADSFGTVRFKCIFINPLVDL